MSAVCPDPRKRAIELAKMSSCAIQHGAVIVKHGEILGEDVNQAFGESGGLHAEIGAIHDALKRCGGKKKKLYGARIICAGIRKSTGRFVETSRPCECLGSRKNIAGIPCMKKIREVGISEIEYVTKTGDWFIEKVEKVEKV
ncbi:MAG: hypothetical protein HYT93_02695 [Parcubacteria group bacterium]|nr:hypothetical protein [Parcubacteria group bacterium]